MALLTADDVLNKKFQATKFRDGYDQDEVDDFLDEVVSTLNELQTANDDLTSKLAAAERRIAELSRAGAAEAVVEPAPVAAPEPVFAPPVPATPEPVVVASSEPESATGMLALAQKLHDDYVRSGQSEAERVVADARTRADQIVHEAEETSSRTLAQLEQERSLLERKIDELRVFERDYRTRLKSYLENLLGDLDNRGSALPSRSSQDTPGL
ncbi:DivIVA domain-containing protein [Cellulomonas citrea]|uniref:DivIVA domain-containing protein n=1 Tax=Cellulomonas citrea TaxID=1909423 RepID=UPI00135745BE|nr:DivIVA domain-containing protein [Cellulomonas citrea]